MMPSFYEMITEKSFWREEQSGDKKVRVSFAFDDGKRPAKAIDFDGDRLGRCPVSWAEGLILWPDAYEAIHQLVEWGYFHHGTAEV